MATRSAAVLAWSALLGVSARPARAQSWVQGVVYERAGESTRPLPRAFISLWSFSGELLGTMRTDGRGRYQFANLPQDRLTLAASKPGYLVRQAAGRAGPRAIVDCSAGCRQSGIDFELFRGAVLAGTVLDGLGEPVARAVVQARRTDAQAAGEKPLSDETDDRGRFRLAGLMGGSYTVSVQMRVRRGEGEIAARTLKVGEGEQMLDLVLTPAGSGSFRVSGSVSGIPFGEGYRTWVEVRPLSGSGRALQASVGPDGRFQFQSVPAGRYRADAAVVELGAVQRTDHFLDVVEVVADTDGIALQPVAPATVAGTVEIAVGAPPAGIALRFTSRDGFGYRLTRVRGTGAQFEVSGLRPGTYRVEADSAESYVKGVKSGGEVASPDEVVLSPGVNSLTVILAADHGQVLGVVGDPKTGRPLPHARVALQGESGKYSAEADQAGRFLFSRVIPGEYRICAWSSLEPERVEDKVSWEQGGCYLRMLPIAPSSRTEIDLPAAR